MCNSSGAVNNDRNLQMNFNTQIAGQAQQVFGQDSQIFNDMMKQYSAITSQGPDQHGFNQGQRNEMDAAAITNNANQFRNVAGAVKSGEAGFGGGNDISMSGVTVGRDQSVAERAAANTASDLNAINQEDWNVGREQFWKAASGEMALPGVMSNAVAFDKVGSKALADNTQIQQQKDAAANWWQKPVMGLAAAGLGMATGGLSTPFTSAFLNNMPGANQDNNNNGDNSNATGWRNSPLGKLFGGGQNSGGGSESSLYIASDGTPIGTGDLAGDGSIGGGGGGGGVGSW